MSGKRFNPLDYPPTASSSDEDEVETSIKRNSSSEEEEDDDDESSRNPSVKKPETVLGAAEKNQVSDSESGSEEETDPDSGTERKYQIAKPVPSIVKSVTETKDSIVKNHDSKKSKASAKSETKKRSSETDGAAASTDAKRVKRISGEDEKKSDGGEETKKTYFQRVWSEEDEIAVLQGMIDYKTDTGLSPGDDKNGVYQLVKKSISFDVSKVQFMEKLRSLKKKFENNLGKGRNGEDPTFSKPHDRKAFDLSKFIWGADGIAHESAVKSDGKSKKSSKSKKVKSVKQELVSSSPNGKNCEDEVTNKGEEPSLGMTELDTKFMKSFLVKSLARFGVDDLAAQQGWSRLASEDKKRFEEQWKALQLREFEFYSEKSGFIHQVVTKMAESFRPNP